MKKQALGKGLNALISDADNISSYSIENISQLKIDEVYPNPDQPRKSFDEVSLNNLIDSINENGVIQPIIVTKTSIGFQIVAGERRWRASKLLKLNTIPAIVRDYDELNKAKIAILENVQREDLNPVEEALAYQLLIDQYGLNHGDLAKSIGKSRPYISNLLRLLALDQKILNYLSENTITFGHAKALMMIPEDYRLEVCTSIIDKGLSVRQVEELSKKQMGPKPKKQVIAQDLFFRKYEAAISEKLGLKTVIDTKGKKSTITINFKSNEEIQRILEILSIEL